MAGNATPRPIGRDRPPTLAELAAAVSVVRAAVRDATWKQTHIGLAAGRYLRWKRSEWGASPRTIRDYEVVLARVAVYHADKAMGDVTRADLSDALDYGWGGTSAGTRAKVVSILHDFFAWAADTELIADDPSRRLRRPRKQTPHRATFTPGEVKLIVSTARGRDRAAVEILFGLAIRKSSLSAIRLGDYDADGGYLRIIAKGAKRQTLPVADPWLRATLDDHWRVRQVEAAAADRDWRAEHLLYPARDMPRRRTDGPQSDRWEDRLRPLSATATAVWWRRIIDAAGVPYRGMHAARHTRLTELVRFGRGGLKHAQLLAGHTNISTTGDIYAHLDVADLADVLRLMAANPTVPDDL